MHGRGAVPALPRRALNLVQTLGEGYALQKQDIFCRQAYHHDVRRMRSS